MNKKLKKRLGYIKSLFYRYPKDEIARMLRWGPRAYFLCDSWMKEMERAAWSLPVLSRETRVDSAPISLWFLTGKRFWYQTAFCAWTFAKQSGREVILNLVDDGTLSDEHEAGLRRLFPQGVTLRKEQVRERVETLLPTKRFPILRKRWDDYINIRKLTDIHLGSSGVKLVLDSDMLFFRKPQAILDWWDAEQGKVGKKTKGERYEGAGNVSSTVVNSHDSPLAPNSQLPAPSSYSPLLMTDCEESYGYSRHLMAELSGATIPPLLNVGICGLRSENLNWEELEHWCRTLLEREGTTYFLEQAIVAMIAAKLSPTVMARSDYITFPTEQQVIERTGVLQHYVSDSKPWYFGKAWRLALGN